MKTELEIKYVIDTLKIDIDKYEKELNEFIERKEDYSIDLYEKELLRLREHLICLLWVID